MQEQIPGAFKKPPKKYTPYGLNIIHEDRDLIICDKTHGLLSVGNESEKERTALNGLNLYVRKGNSASKKRVYLVSRLDKDTSGLLICTKEDKAKRDLQEIWDKLPKTYYAIVHGTPKTEEGTISSKITTEGKNGIKKTVDAETKYKVLSSSKNYSLLEVTVFAMAKHQIRIHLAQDGHPIFGDKLYGNDKGKKRLALHLGKVRMPHPFSKKEYTLTAPTPQLFGQMVKHDEG